MNKTLLSKTINNTLIAGLIATLLSGCFDSSDDKVADNKAEQARLNSVTFTRVSSYVHGDFAESAAEIIGYHPASKREFVVNAQNKKVDVLDLSDVAAPAFVTSLGVTDIGGAVNSVAVHGDLVALAVQAEVKTDNGYVVVYDANTLNRLKTIEVGALPDMVTFTPDGKYLLSANEGEPDDNYRIDAEGSISIITVADIHNPSAKPTARTATFADYNTQKQQLIDSGVRIFGKKADGTPSTVSEDLEPEYIAVSRDSQTAYVSLQENNAIAVVDIANARVTAITPLGAKDHSVAGNELDVSNKDGAINIKSWPIKGMYMPDSIACYSVNGKDYIITANEGDAREWGDFSEEIGFSDVSVDTTTFNSANCHNLECGDKKALGKIDFSQSMGDDDGDGIYEALYSFGARSFSIWDVNDFSAPVYDSGSFMAHYTADRYPDNFNASNVKNSFDNRSDNKGVEPEGVTIGHVGSQTIAFIGLERISSVMAFDVTDPADVRFLGEINTRSFDDDKLKAAKKGSQKADADGDLGPEGLTFLPADQSPSGKPLLLVGFEISGSSVVFELDFSE
ncbi:MAG: alkaline phosphatase [Proteobacteria bacterium]|nr:MAG: alkaline phosphatase [Pseudomonadota bacterium]